MVAPQLSTSRRAIASPRPEPLEVVENAGSKTRGRMSGAIPRPSSSTASPQPPSEIRTVTRRAPALWAFSSRLMRTSFTSSRRADAGPPGAPASSIVASASAPPSVYRCTTSRATASTSTGSSGSASAAGDAKRENARAMASNRSISARIRPAVSASVASKCPPCCFSRRRCRWGIPRRSRGGVAGGHVGQGLRRGPGRALERPVAPRDVGVHALQRRDHGLELARRPGRERGQRRAAPDRAGGIAQRGDRTREYARGEALEIYGHHEPGQRREDEHEREVFLLLLHALVVEQLGGGQDFLDR